MAGGHGQCVSVSHPHCIGPARDIVKGEPRLPVGPDPQTDSETARIMPLRHHLDKTLGV